MPNPEDIMDFTQEVQDPDEYTLAWNGWDANTNTDILKRKAIKIKLDQMNFGVNPSTLDSTAIQDYADPAAGIDYEGDAYVGGVVLVQVYFKDDGTKQSGKIVQGQPVVFDTVTGYSVTGIHASWGIDEYKIAGTAMANFPDDTNTSTRIPVRLTPPAAPVDTSVTIGRCVKKKYAETTLQQWLKQGLQRCVWEFEIMSKDIQITNDGSVSAHPATGSTAQPLRPRLETGYDDSWSSSDPSRGAVTGTVVEVFNLPRHFIPIGEVTVLYKRGSQYYCKSYMQQMIIGTLDAIFSGIPGTYPNSTTDTVGKLRSLTTCKDAPIDVYDYAKLMPASKLGPGTAVVAGLIRTSLGTGNPSSSSTNLTTNAADKNAGNPTDDGQGVETSKLWGLLPYSNEWANTSYVYTLIAVSACPTVITPPTSGDSGGSPP